MWWKSIMARGIFLFFACLFKHVNLNWLSRKESKFKIASRLADKTDFDNRYSKFEAWGYRIFHIWVTNSILWSSWPKKKPHHWFDSKLSISILITTEAVRMFVMLWFFGDFNTNHLWKTMKLFAGRRRPFLFIPNNKNKHFSSQSCGIILFYFSPFSLKPTKLVYKFHFISLKPKQLPFTIILGLWVFF